MTDRQVPPAVSVIIPAFNAARYLGEALASVRAQTLQPAEIIVVDNASTDATSEIARESGVRCEHEPVRGSGSARNRGVAAAGGDFIAFLDADDLWEPQKLEWQMALLEAHPEIDAAFGHIAHFLSPDLAPHEAAKLHCPEGAAPVRLPSLMLIRRAAFGRVGPFSTAGSVGDVVEWMVRAEAAGMRHAMVPHVVCRRRLHASNMGRVLRDERANYLRIIKQKLDRERAAGK
ncbi:MAG: glycosyltransferase family A protein [Chthoniobacteraceae bacterium]